MPSRNTLPITDTAIQRLTDSGLNPVQIAARLGTSERTIRSRIHRLRENGVTLKTAPKPESKPTFRAKFNEKGWTIIDRHNKHVACGRWFADLPLPVAEAETKERLTEYVKGHGKAGDVSYQRILLFDRVKAARV